MFYFKCFALLISKQQTVTCTRTVVHYYSMIITVGLPRGDIGGDILVLNKSSPDITPTQTEDITD